MKTTYYAGKLGGRWTIMDPDKVNTDSPAIKMFEFDHREITGEDEIEAGRRVADAGLIAANGTADEGAVSMHKGYTLIERMATDWNQKAGDAPLPLNRPNVKTLPGCIARQFAVDQLVGKVATQDEMDAILKKPQAPTGDTAQMEQSA